MPHSPCDEGLLLDLIAGRGPAVELFVLVRPRPPHEGAPVAHAGEADQIGVSLDHRKWLEVKGDVPRAAYRNVDLVRRPAASCQISKHAAIALVDSQPHPVLWRRA